MPKTFFQPKGQHLSPKAAAAAVLAAQHHKSPPPGAVVKRGPKGIGVRVDNLRLNTNDGMGNVKVVVQCKRQRGMQIESLVSIV